MLAPTMYPATSKLMRMNLPWRKEKWFYVSDISTVIIQIDDTSIKHLITYSICLYKY